MDTYMAKPGEVGGRWYLVDAKGKTLGRLASTVATILYGKHQPGFTPGVDCGDHVVVINADQVIVTGKKLQNKMVYRHSMYPGGLKTYRFGDLLAKRPESVLTKAVRGMLPKTRLGRKMLRKLRVYRGSEHPHQAQQPQVFDIDVRIGR